MSDPLNPSTALLVKIGSLIVHMEEAASPSGHSFDRQAAENLRQDPSVVEWFKGMTSLGLLPVKRNVTLGSEPIDQAIRSLRGKRRAKRRGGGK